MGLEAGGIYAPAPANLQSSNFTSKQTGFADVPLYRLTDLLKQVPELIGKYSDEFPEIQRLSDDDREQYFNILRNARLVLSQYGMKESLRVFFGRFASDARFIAALSNDDSVRLDIGWNCRPLDPVALGTPGVGAAHAPFVDEERRPPRLSEDIFAFRIGHRELDAFFGGILDDDRKPFSVIPYHQFLITNSVHLEGNFGGVQILFPGINPDSMTSQHPMFSFVKAGVEKATFYVLTKAFSHTAGINIESQNTNMNQKQLYNHLVEKLLPMLATMRHGSTFAVPWAARGVRLELSFLMTLTSFSEKVSDLPTWVTGLLRLFDIQRLRSNFSNAYSLSSGNRTLSLVRIPVARWMLEMEHLLALGIVNDFYSLKFNRANQSNWVSQAALKWFCTLAKTFGLSHAWKLHRSYFEGLKIRLVRPLPGQTATVFPRGVHSFFCGGLQLPIDGSRLLEVHQVVALGQQHPDFMHAAGCQAAVIDGGADFWLRNPHHPITLANLVERIEAQCGRAILKDMPSTNAATLTENEELVLTALPLKWRCIFKETAFVQIPSYIRGVALTFIYTGSSGSRRAKHFDLTIFGRLEATAYIALRHFVDCQKVLEKLVVCHVRPPR